MTTLLHQAIDMIERQDLSHWSDDHDRAVLAVLRREVAQPPASLTSPHTSPGGPGQAVPMPASGVVREDGGSDAGHALTGLIAYLREEADFNRSWTDGRRGNLVPGEEYAKRRLDLAQRADNWADEIERLSRHGELPAASVEPLFWYRPRSDSLYEGPIHNASIERVRKESGGWVPLYPGATPVAAQAPAVNAHTDDDAVDHFAAAMKEKLAQARAKGRSGWHECDPADLSRMLRAHVEKGDARDVANFCMFLWSLGKPISAAPVAAGDALDAAFEAVRKRLCALPRYSFHLNNGGVRRVQDRTGNWIEFQDAHELFDPLAIDPAMRTTGREGE